MMRKGRELSLITSGGKGGTEEGRRTKDFQKDINVTKCVLSVGVELNTKHSVVCAEELYICSVFAKYFQALNNVKAAHL